MRFLPWTTGAPTSVQSAAGTLKLVRVVSTMTVASTINAASLKLKSLLKRNALTSVIISNQSQGQARGALHETP